MEKYENEKLEESKRPIINIHDIYSIASFANERSKKEKLDTAYIMVNPKSKEAKNLMLLDDPNKEYNSCDSCTMLALDTLASGYRVPFKDEWFYLMRAGASTAFFWGDENQAYFNKEDSVKIARYAWIAPFAPKEPVKLKPVGQLLPNAFGLYDMIGIAKEYCDLSPERMLMCGVSDRGLGSVVGADYDSFRLVRKTPKLQKLEKFRR